jgi:ribosomal protein L19E
MLHKSLLPALVLIGALLLPAGDAAAQLYKWVDENGQVHFSQTPPPAVTATNPTFQSVNINARPARAVHPERTGSTLRCGSMMLPQERSDPAIYIANLRRTLDSYQEQERAAQAEHSRLLDERRSHSGTERASMFDHQIEAAKRRWDEVSCALEWSRQELVRLDDVRTQFIQSHTELEQELAQLEASHAACNAEGKGLLVGPEAQRVYQCEQQYNNRIRELRDQLRRYRGVKDAIE